MLSESEIGLMTKNFKRLTLVATMMALMASIASLGAASPALASESVFAIFSNCPLHAFEEKGVSPGRALCSYNQTTSGEFAIGSTKVPINQTITLEGGFVPTGNPDNEVEYFLIPGANGQNISKTELNVPAGLAGLINCEEIKGEGLTEKLARVACKTVFESKLTGVTATTEIVANESNPAIVNEFALNRESGTAITLPVRVHLKNPLLGSSCFIGSESSPIELHLTTGATSPEPPNESIHGNRGKLGSIEEYEELGLNLSGDSLVDNSFSVPVVQGCGGALSSVLDPVIDLKLKLPSADGNNTAILDGDLNVTPAETLEIVKRIRKEKGEEF
jgi:hypothetical protein